MHDHEYTYFTDVYGMIMFKLTLCVVALSFILTGFIQIFFSLLILSGLAAFVYYFIALETKEGMFVQLLCVLSDVEISFQQLYQLYMIVYLVLVKVRM